MVLEPLTDERQVQEDQQKFEQSMRKVPNFIPGQ